jgi:glycogen operon protein
MTLAAFDGGSDLHIMLNMHWESLDFELPSVQGRYWLIAVDTSMPSPLDITAFGNERPVVAKWCAVRARSVVVLVNRALKSAGQEENPVLRC